MSDTHNIGCEEALKRLYTYLDRELDQRAHGEMEHHLSRCRGCYSRVEFEKRLKARLRETGHGEIPAQLRRRIGQLLRNY